MIHLIDDTPLEMLNRYMDVEDYRDILVRIDNLDMSDLSVLSDSDCILIHSSYHDTRVKKQIQILADFGDRIPLVCFSDGDLPEAEWDGNNSITAFKKTRMYSYLPIFLSLYRKYGEINLKILADGEHYLRKEAEQLAVTILDPLMFLEASAPIAFTDEQWVAFKEFFSLTQPEIGISYSEVRKKITSMSIGEFRSQINRIIDDFNKYGKNLHSWR